MTTRLKVLRKQEERINKVKELMDIYSIKVPNYPYNNDNYQPMGASSTSADPRIQKTRNLFEMFHLVR